MNENDPVDPTESIRQIGDVKDSAKSEPRFGPGWLAMALPNIGHAPSCKAITFAHSEDLNAWAEDCAQGGRAPLIYYMAPIGGKILVVYTTQKSEETVEEMRLVSIWVDEKMQELKAKREELKAADEKVKEESAKRDSGLMVLGRLCVEKHGIAHDLPAMSIIKNMRKNLADDILKLFITNVPKENQDGVVEKLNKVLKDYVKDGAK